MAEDIQERIRSAQTRVSQATAQRTRQEVARENAETAQKNAKQALVDDFQVVTSADLKAKRAELEEARDAALAEVESQLEAAGA